MVFVPTQIFTISYTANVHGASKNLVSYAWSCIGLQVFCYKPKQNGCCQHKPVLVLLSLRMHTNSQ